MKIFPKDVPSLHFRWSFKIIPLKLSEFPFQMHFSNRTIPQVAIYLNLQEERRRRILISLHFTLFVVAKHKLSQRQPWRDVCNLINERSLRTFPELRAKQRGGRTEVAECLVANQLRLMSCSHLSHLVVKISPRPHHFFSSWWVWQMYARNFPTPANYGKCRSVAAVERDGYDDDDAVPTSKDEMRWAWEEFATLKVDTV